MLRRIARFAPFSPGLHGKAPGSPAAHPSQISRRASESDLPPHMRVRSPAAHPSQISRHTSESDLPPRIPPRRALNTAESEPLRTRPSGDAAALRPPPPRRGPAGSGRRASCRPAPACTLLLPFEQDYFTPRRLLTIQTRRETAWSYSVVRMCAVCEREMGNWVQCVTVCLPRHRAWAKVKHIFENYLK